MSEHASKTSIKEKVVNFYGSLELNDMDTLDVITKLECSAPFVLTVNGHTVNRSAEVLELCLPICLLPYSACRIVTGKDETLHKLTLTSVGLNKLRIKHDDYKIILDDVVMKDWVVYSGCCHPQLDSSLKQAGKGNNRKVCDMVIREMNILGTKYQIGAKCNCGGYVDEFNLVVSMLVSHPKILDGGLHEEQRNFTMSHAIQQSDGSYTVFYTSPLNGLDIIHYISGVPEEVDNEVYLKFKSGKTKIANGEIINFPHIAVPTGVQLVLRNIPSDKLYSYKSLMLTVFYILFQHEQREKLRDYDIKNWM